MNALAEVLGFAALMAATYVVLRVSLGAVAWLIEHRRGDR